MKGEVWKFMITIDDLPTCGEITPGYWRWSYQQKDDLYSNLNNWRGGGVVNY